MNDELYEFIIEVQDYIVKRANIYAQKSIEYRELNEEEKRMLCVGRVMAYNDIIAHIEEMKVR